MFKIESISSNIAVREEFENEFKTRYILEPLYRGYGHTIGNILRRVLLSSIPGAAIKAVKINNVLNEFSVIEGIKENVVDIILNIKGLVVKAQTPGEKLMHLSVKGPCVVTGADVVAGENLEIINKEHVIANISKDIAFDIEFLVDTGEGFIVSEEINKEGWPEGFLAVDALYSPIRNVSFKVEDTMFGRITNFNRLIIDLETNGSISSKDAMSYAVELIFKHLTPILNIGDRMEHLRVGNEIEEANAAAAAPSTAGAKVKEKGHHDMRLEDLDFTVRSYNCLKKLGVETLRDISKYTAKDLMQIKNLGKKSLTEIIEKAKSHGIDLTANE